MIYDVQIIKSALQKKGFVNIQLAEQEDLYTGNKNLMFLFFSKGQAEKALIGELYSAPDEFGL